MSTNKRIRGRALQRARAQLQRANPLCVICSANGRVKAGTERDHIVPIEFGGSEDVSNTQWICRECHDAKTRKDRGYKVSGAVGPDGYPLSEEHPWNQQA